MIRKICLLFALIFSFANGYAQLQSKYGEYVAYRSPQVWSGNVVTSYSWYIVHFENPDAIFFTHHNSSVTPMANSIIKSDLEKDPNFINWAKGNEPETKYFVMKYNSGKSNSYEDCYQKYNPPIFGTPVGASWSYFYFSKDFKTLRVVSSSDGSEQKYERASLTDLFKNSGSSAVSRMRRESKEDGKIYE